jgi:hypothetical protein
MEELQISDWTLNEKKILLQKLGYDTDGVFVVKDGKRFQDAYLKQDISINNMLILPGSTVVIDNNPLSIAYYLQDHGELFA